MDMTQEEILEGNKLIAEFMDLKQVDWNNEYILWVRKGFVEDYTDVKNYSDSSKFDWENSLPQSEKLYYHSSWDWLMPVYHKILKEEKYEKDEESIILFNILYDSLGDGEDIEEVWKNLVNLLKIMQ